VSYALNLDFKAGVDRRRPISAGVTGTLWECVNAHITRGGDIEKRKAFVETYALEPGTFGLAQAAGDLYVFGSAVAPAMPADVTYQRLQHPDALAMTRIVDVDTFNGKLYVVAEYSDGATYHFYDGVIVASLVNGAVRASMTNNSGIAAHLNTLIDADAAYDPAVLANVITVTAAVAGVPFTITSATVNKTGGTDDQTAVVATTTPASAAVTVAAVTEVLASATFTVAAGSVSAGVNTTNSITVNGAQILGASVDHTGNNTTTAAAIVAQCVSFASTPEYTVTNSGAVVTITALAGTGATPNGFAVAITNGGNVVTTPASGIVLAGGVTAVVGGTTPAVKQVSTITIGGTFEAGDKFRVTLDGKNFGFTGSTSFGTTAVLTHESKVYTTAGSITQFSGVNAPAGNDSDVSTGAGSINMSNHSAGSEALTGLEVYQAKLAVFSRRVIQIWTMASDPASNAKFQILKKTGSRATRSIYAYGDNDLMYLSDSGIRSLRARDSGNQAAVFDIGTVIDPLVKTHVSTLTAEQIEAAVSVIDPEDGRFWMAIGNKIFVYTNFISVGISAWSVYEPGFVPSDMVDVDDRVYVRSDDTIYLYGGPDNDSYDTDEDDNYPVTVQPPYVHSDKPASGRQLCGYNADVENVWDLKLYISPAHPTEYVDIGLIEGFQYNDGMIGAVGQATHVSPKLVCTTPGAARVSNMAVHFTKGYQAT
jgi:hypothetical protein